MVVSACVAAPPVPGALIHGPLRPLECVVIDGLLINLSLLITGLFLVSLTYQRTSPQTWLLVVLRTALTVGTGLLLMGHSLVIASGLIFDFRTVVIALASRRNGLLPGLLVALPLAIYRWHLGGVGAWFGIANMLLVALLFSSKLLDVSPQFSREQLYRQWWVPLRIFALAFLITLPPFWLTQRPSSVTLLTYVTFVVLSTFGMIVGHFVTQGRLETLAEVSGLTQVAFEDALTGSANRRQFDLDLPQALPPTALLLLDLDHFKQVNDTYGHAAGDRVLQVTAQVLSDGLRPSDTVYRIGGEEFAVLLRRCPPQAAAAIAERLRRAVEQRLASEAQLPHGSLTVSCGLISLSGDTAGDLRRADQALYAAKHQGRNRVVVSPS